MGTRIKRRSPNSTNFQPFGTLGHPRDSNGRLVFSTSHGGIPQYSTVYTMNGLYIGTVLRPVRLPSSGIDVSLIRLNQGIFISRMIPGTSQSINTFFADSRQTNPSSVTMHGAVSGNVVGNILHHSIDLNFDSFLWRDMLVANIRGTQGDSGAALTSNGRVYGTAAFGSQSLEIGFFSRAINYQHIQPWPWQ